MVEETYLCHHCRDIFKSPMTCSIVPGVKEVKCPECGSSHTEEIPSWGPIGFDVPLLVWEYECQGCHSVFELPVPSSPSQEKEIKCAECGGGHIHRLTPTGGVPLYCG